MIDDAIERAFSNRRTLTCAEVAEVLHVSVRLTEEWARAHGILRWNLSAVEALEAELANDA